MSVAKTLFGKVFISHSSIDKPFARRLARGLERAGFRTWLDEKELLPGDPLAQKLSEALMKAGAVLVVVSSASAKSKWLAFELNKATDRMVKGDCRVIPAIKEQISLPPEVAGLLYADFTKNFALGLKSIVTALTHDARQRSMDQSFWRRSKVMIEEIFGGTGFVLGGGEYKSIDYEIVRVEEETWAAYEIVDAYGDKMRPLTERWWDEFSETVESYSENLFLVLSKRPIEFAVQRSPGEDKRVGFRLLGSGYAVIADLSNLSSHEEERKFLGLAKAKLMELASELSKREAAIRSLRSSLKRKLKRSGRFGC